MVTDGSCSRRVVDALRFAEEAQNAPRVVFALDRMRELVRDALAPGLPAVPGACEATAALPAELA